MAIRLKPLLLPAALTAVGLLASACANTSAMARDDARVANDFGRAVREDLAAQIVNPEGTWKTPRPLFNGQRAGQAETRYNSGTVKQPSVQSSTSGVGG